MSMGAMYCELGVIVDGVSVLSVAHPTVVSVRAGQACTTSYRRSVTQSGNRWITGDTGPV